MGDADMRQTGNITLGAARPSEAGEIAAMSRLHVEFGLSWRWTPARIRRQIRDKETMVLAARNHGTIVGFAIMRFGEHQAHLLLLAVRPDSRRNGIASTLMAWLEQSCRTAGIQAIRLEVRAANQGARLFYRQLGFRLIARVAGYYDGREAAVVMARPLWPAAD